MQPLCQAFFANDQVFFRPCSLQIEVGDPPFFNISDITNSSSFNGKIFRKKSKFENFRANVLNQHISKSNNLVGTRLPLDQHLNQHLINTYLNSWQSGDQLKCIFLINFIRLSFHKITNMQKKQIPIESGNAAQKGRYERETHVRYCLDDKKSKNIRCMTK